MCVMYVTRVCVCMYFMYARPRGIYGMCVCMRVMCVCYECYVC